MFNQLLNRIQGEVSVRLEHPAPEQILNLCAEQEIAFWNLEWESPAVMTFSLTRRDWRRLHALVPDESVCVLSQSGLPSFFIRLYRRPALLSCLVICATALFTGSFFIWDYDVTGNETVPEERILRALEKYGAGPGTFAMTLDGENIRNHVLLDIPELQWISVNVSGCRAFVQVAERKMPPEIPDQHTPANITARRDGLILSVRALDGKAVVRPGMTVTEGQLLISGMENLETVGTVRFMTGYGSVTARTWHTLHTSVNLQGTQKVYTDSSGTCYSLLIGRRRIKFFSNRAVTDLEDGAEYDKITHRTSCTLLGIRLPFTLAREEYHFYETLPAERSATELQKQMETVLLEQLAAEIAPYGEIRSAICSGRVRGNVLDVTLSAECVEEIGIRVPLDTVP